MNHRIKKLRRELDLTQEKFGEHIGVKGNTVAQWESGRNDPPDYAIAFICREFYVNERWIRTGEGEMFKPKPTDVLDQLAYKYQLSNSDYVIIEKFLALRPEIRNGIFDYIHEVAAALNDESDPSSPAYTGEYPPLPMDDIIASGTAAAEAAYEKAFGIQSDTESQTSNITGDTPEQQKA